MMIKLWLRIGLTFLLFTVGCGEKENSELKKALRSASPATEHIAKKEGKENSESEKALRSVFPAAEHIAKKTAIVLEQQRKKIGDLARIEKVDATFTYYQAEKGGEIIGYAVIGRASGKVKDFTYMLCLAPKGKIERLEILEYEEARGRGVKRKGFLGQFEGKTMADPLKLGKDIDGVTGATISCRGLTEAVHTVLRYFWVILDLEPNKQADTSRNEGLGL